MKMTALDRLDEIEREPWKVDRLDIEALLDACEFDETVYGRVGVWYQDDWKAEVTLHKDQRTMSQKRVDGICSMIRYFLSRGGMP